MEKKKFYLIDAAKKPLGRLATKVAVLLLGKNSADFKKNALAKNIVIIINAKNIYLTGNKSSSKQYFRYTGYHGGIKSKKFTEVTPSEAIKRAVYGMLPDNKLRKEMMKNLKIFPGKEHPGFSDDTLIKEQKDDRKE